MTNESSREAVSYIYKDFMILFPVFIFNWIVGKEIVKNIVSTYCILQMKILFKISDFMYEISTYNIIFDV